MMQQHNIRVLSRYYKRVRLSRAADLLTLSAAEVGGRCIVSACVFAV